MRISPLGARFIEGIVEQSDESIPRAVSPQANNARRCLCAGMCSPRMFFASGKFALSYAMQFAGA